MYVDLLLGTIKPSDLAPMDCLQKPRVVVPEKLIRDWTPLGDVYVLATEELEGLLKKDVDQRTVVYSVELAVYTIIGSVCANEAFANSASIVGRHWFKSSYPLKHDNNRKYSWMERLSRAVNPPGRTGRYFSSFHEFSCNVEQLRLRFVTASNAACGLLCRDLAHLGVKRKVKSLTALNTQLPQAFSATGWASTVDRLQGLLESKASELRYNDVAAWVESSSLLEM